MGGICDEGRRDRMRWRRALRSGVPGATMRELTLVVYGQLIIESRKFFPVENTTSSPTRNDVKAAVLPP